MMCDTIIKSIISEKNIDNPYAKKIYDHHEYFHRVVDIFDESESTFRPSKDLLSVAGQILHVSILIEYFLSGLFGKYEGFSPLSDQELGFMDMSWTKIADEKHLHLVLDPIKWPRAFIASTSVVEALKLFDEAMTKAVEFIGAMSSQDFAVAKPPINPVFAPEKFKYPDILEVMNDHTAHHRGALVVYAHLLEKDPRMPYFDLENIRACAKQLQITSV